MPAEIASVWGDTFYREKEKVWGKGGALSPGPAKARPLPPPPVVSALAASPPPPRPAIAPDTYDDLFPEKYWNIFIVVSIVSIVVLLLSLHSKVSKLCMLQAALLASGGGGGGGRPGPLVWGH